MKIFMEPIVDVLENGTVNTVVIRATPSMVENRIKNLDGFKKAKFDFDKIVDIIQGVTSIEDAIKQLRKEFGLTHTQANFMLNVSIKELSVFCNPEEWQIEVGKWKALKELVKEETEGFGI